VRKDLEPAIIKALQGVLLGLSQGPDRKLLKHLYNVDGYVKVSHKDYLKVEKVARSFGLLRGK
ncbi:MAG: hypothetical protein V3T77_05250, partial [Planctomycetota bacterium]